MNSMLFFMLVFTSTSERAANIVFKVTWGRLSLRTWSGRVTCIHPHHVTALRLRAAACVQSCRTLVPWCSVGFVCWNWRTTRHCDRKSYGSNLRATLVVWHIVRPDFLQKDANNKNPVKLWRASAHSDYLVSEMLSTTCLYHLCILNCTVFDHLADNAGRFKAAIYMHRWHDGP